MLEYRNQLIAPAPQAARAQVKPLLKVNPPQVILVAERQNPDQDMTDTVLSQDLQSAMEQMVLFEKPQAAMEDSVPSEKPQAAIDAPMVEVRENEVFVDNFMPSQWSRAAMDF
jgi:hypothetical protein